MDIPLDGGAGYPKGGDTLFPALSAVATAGAKGRENTEPINTSGRKRPKLWAVHFNIKTGEVRMVPQADIAASTAIPAGEIHPDPAMVW